MAAAENPAFRVDARPSYGKARMQQLWDDRREVCHDEQHDAFVAMVQLEFSTARDRRSAQARSRAKVSSDTRDAQTRFRHQWQSLIGWLASAQQVDVVIVPETKHWRSSTTGSGPHHEYWSASYSESLAYGHVRLAADVVSAPSKTAKPNEAIAATLAVHLPGVAASAVENKTVRDRATSNRELVAYGARTLPLRALLKKTDDADEPDTALDVRLSHGAQIVVEYSASKSHNARFGNTRRSAWEPAGFAFGTSLSVEPGVASAQPTSALFRTTIFGITTAQTFGWVELDLVGSYNRHVVVPAALKLLTTHGVLKELASVVSEYVLPALGAFGACAELTTPLLASS
jgi:hypothetical protein